MKSQNSKKPTDISFPTIEKKPPQLKKITETDICRKRLCSPTRMLSTLTISPLSKRSNSPSSGSRIYTPKSAKAANMSSWKSSKNVSPLKIQKQKKQKNIVPDEPKISIDEVDRTIGKDSQISSDEYQKVSSTKCSEKDLELNSFREEEEKEREKLTDMIGIYGMRPENKAVNKRQKKFAQLSSSLSKSNQTDSSKMTSPEKEKLENRESLKSTVLIMGLNIESDSVKDEETPTGNSETASVEHSSIRSEEKIGLSGIWSDIKKPSERTVTPKNTSKSSIELNWEIYFIIENLLRLSKEAILGKQPVMEIFREYVGLAPKKDLESFEKIFANDKEVKIVRSSFILERLAVVLLLYFTQEVKETKTIGLLTKALIRVTHENCLLFGCLASHLLRDKMFENVWIEKLIRMMESDPSLIATKEKHLERMQKNNTTLGNTLKNLIVSLQNKEAIYALNSVIVQLDRIPIKEAYSRLVKCLSLYMSEQELKSQESKYKESIRRFSKTEKSIKTEEDCSTSRHGSLPEVVEPESILVIQEIEEAVSFYLPALRPEKAESTYTLVMDLDETLVHFAEIAGGMNELRVRPYVEYFLTQVSQHFEIVIFTTGTQEYADWVLDNIDKQKVISHRLYRHHASTDENSMAFIKDLSKLGRDLSRVLIVDNIPENFKLQPDNGIAIKSWYDDHEDNALLELAPLLIGLTNGKVSDVREALRRFREQMLENIENGVENPHLNVALE